MSVAAQGDGCFNNRLGFAMSTVQISAADGTRRGADFSQFVSHPANQPPILVTVTGIRPNLWTVESSDHSVGGTFVSRKAALAFAQEAMVSSNAAVVVNEDRIMNGGQHFGRGFLGATHRDANARIQRPCISATRRGAESARDPLFTEREVAIGFSLLALTAAISALT